jgi:hypothetical protein
MNMNQKDKSLCKLFEDEVWLYISDELDEEKKAMWEKHITGCSTCSNLLKSDMEISALYKENMAEDMLDSSFAMMIEKATAERTLSEKTKYFFSGLGKSFLFGKIIFGGALVTASLLILLFSQRPNPVRQIAEKMITHEDTTISTASEKVPAPAFPNSSSVDKKEEEWNNSVSDIQNGITRMEKEINQN